MTLRGLLRLGAAACPLVLAAPAAAIYVGAEVNRVPVDRLVANLERELAADPRNAALHVNLARLHGMAFALKAEELPATSVRPEDREKPWYGHEPKLIPYEVKPAPSEERARQAAAHLASALDHYQTALRLDPASLLARLGYAWMLEKAGKTEEAIDEYRRVIADAWPKEEEVTRADLGQRFYTEEAAAYLIPLLDRERDAAEIATLRERQQKLRALPRPITPIAIPLTERLRSNRIIDRTAQVRFDADGSGLSQQWTWISRDAGWLVYDADGAGAITSALQWFGNVTFWLFWTNGYDALAALDDNGDGELAGGELKHLAIWHDQNQNGRSEPGEVQPLQAYGIAAVSCRYVDGDGVELAAVSPRGIRFIDGSTRPTYDVILRLAAVRQFTSSPIPAALPDSISPRHRHEIPTRARTLSRSQDARLASQGTPTKSSRRTREIRRPVRDRR